MFKPIIAVVASAIKNNTVKSTQDYPVVVNGIYVHFPELAEELSHWTHVQ